MNYFRASLANYASLVSGSGVDTYLIPYTFNTPIVLSTTQTAVYNLLFPVSGEANVIAYVNAYTQLLHSFRQDSVFTLYDPVITYQLSDLNQFPNTTVNLIPVLQTMLTTQIGNNFFNQYPEEKYLDMYIYAVPKLMRLVGLVAGYAVSLG